VISISVTSPSVFLNAVEANFMLKFILGSDQGPHLGYEKGHFLIGYTADSPVAWHTLASGKTITDAVNEFLRIKTDSPGSEETRRTVLTKAYHALGTDPSNNDEELDDLDQKLELLLSPSAGMLTDGSRKVKLGDLPILVREGLIDFLSK
jgi:hypothetical protein